MRPPPEAEIAAPEFPPRLEWLGVPLLRMDRLLGRHAVLIEFWDFARVNSLRTLPYLNAWVERYADAGLQLIGVHSPGYSFGRDRDTVARAVERLELAYPVLLDPELEVWRDYGNKGWPGRYLFDRRGLLRYIHYGEGDYADAELAIQECLRELGEEFEPPAVLEPLRLEDEPGALLEPQTADITLPSDRGRLELVRDWVEGEDFLEAADAGAAASFEYRAGGAYAVLSGAELEPGLYEAHGTVEAEAPGLRLHGVQFTPLPPPAPSGSP
jgi:AhpC/TSA family protein